MNTLDIVFGAIVLILTLRGLARGIVREAASLAGLVLAFYLAGRYHVQAAPWLEQWIPADRWRLSAAYFGVFVAVLAGVWLLTKLADGLLKAVRMAWAGHALGGAFGFAKGVAVCAVIHLVMATYLPEAKVRRGSLLDPQVGKVAGYLAHLLPDDMKSALAKSHAALEGMALTLPDLPLPGTARASDEGRKAAPDTSSN